MLYVCVEPRSYTSGNLQTLLSNSVLTQSEKITCENVFPHAHQKVKERRKFWNHVKFSTPIFIKFDDRSRNMCVCTALVADPGFSWGRGTNSQSGCANLFFPRKLHENETIWTPGGGGVGASLAPLP